MEFETEKLVGELIVCSGSLPGFEALTIGELIVEEFTIGKLIVCSGLLPGFEESTIGELIVCSGLSPGFFYVFQISIIQLVVRPGNVLIYGFRCDT